MNGIWNIGMGELESGERLVMVWLDACVIGLDPCRGVFPSWS